MINIKCTIFQFFPELFNSNRHFSLSFWANYCSLTNNRPRWQLSTHDIMPGVYSGPRLSVWHNETDIDMGVVVWLIIVELTPIILSSWGNDLQANIASEVSLLPILASDCQRLITWCGYWPEIHLVTWILATDWHKIITWPGYWPLIGCHLAPQSCLFHSCLTVWVSMTGTKVKCRNLSQLKAWSSAPTQWGVISTFLISANQRPALLVPANQKSPPGFHLASLGSLNNEFTVYKPIRVLVRNLFLTAWVNCYWILIHDKSLNNIRT